MVLRVIPFKVMSIDELGLPPVLKKHRRGRARPGAGHRHHRQRQEHDAGGDDRPHQHAPGRRTSSPSKIRSSTCTRTTKSIITQREIGVDTRSFAYALRSALRQDPDVILVGEMRDMETIETALHAAETGHLVFSTLHTLDATETINRIISVFPPHQQKQIRLQLAAVLKAAVAQRLIPRADGKGRAAGGRSAGRHAVHQGLHHRQGKDAPDPRRHRAGHVAVRHADVRPVDLRPVLARADHLRRSAALGVERRRVQAARSRASPPRRTGPRPDGRRPVLRAGGGGPQVRRPRSRDLRQSSRARPRTLHAPTAYCRMLRPARSSRRPRCAHVSPAAAAMPTPSTGPRAPASGIAPSTTAAWRAPRRASKPRSGSAARPACVSSLQSHGADRDVCRRPSTEAFEEVDEEALLDAASSGRLRGQGAGRTRRQAPAPASSADWSARASRSLRRQALADLAGLGAGARASRLASPLATKILRCIRTRSAPPS